MLWDRRRFTSHTNRAWVATTEFPGFSSRMTPPAHITRIINMTVLSHNKAEEGRAARRRKNDFLDVYMPCMHLSKTSFRLRSLLDLLTDGIFSSPSGTRRSRAPVPLFTGTNDEQHSANTPIRSFQDPLSISFIANTIPALEFKSSGFRRPDVAAFLRPYSKS